MEERRPDPDALLAEIQGEAAEADGRARKGRLKVFFGATAGVGKTYAMLEAARERARAGLDVVVGIVETHGRRETAALLEGLEVLPRKRVEYRGVILEEMDLDAAIARAPDALLVDELAHSNAPGSRHTKRWQDVEELLEAGIDVYTTVNVQHVESLNDVVARVTGVRMQETVPDRLVETADEVELIDLPPDELLQRLSEGKVYVPEQVARARDHFFKRGNLIALRQLALRFTAGHVDERMRGYRRAHAVGDTWPVAERLLVGVGPAPSSASLVRETKRMATRLGAEWHAVFVETPESANWPEADRQRVWETLRLARELGAETATVGGSGAAALLDYARRENVTRIVVGKPRRTRLRDRLFGSPVDELIRRSGDIGLYVIAGEAEEGPGLARVAAGSRRQEPRDLLIALVAVAACTTVGVVVRERTDLANVVMLYLAVIVLLAAMLGRRPALVASVLSVAAFDFFCVPPYGTFAVTDTRYVPVFAVMLVVGVVVSTLTARLRAEAEASRLREDRTAALLGVTRELIPLQEPAAIAALVTRKLSALFDSPVRLLAPDPFRRFRDLEPNGTGEEAAAPVVADWVRTHGKPAGRGTGTLPEAPALYVPVHAGGDALAVLEIASGAERFRDPEQMQLLETFARQAGAALERARLASQSRRAEHLAEMSRLKSRFVAVAAHELRNPLNSLGLAVELLAERFGAQVEREPGGAELLRAARGDVGRLRALAKELLDLSRLEAGAIELHRVRSAPADLVGAAVTAAAIAARERGKAVQTDVAADLPTVTADPDYVGRALGNLIDNALRFARAKVVVGADALPGFVQFTVADDGPGLAVHDQARVFEPFAAEGGRESVGLGLSITREIVRAHGGDIWVDSGPGPGAVFTFTLPTVDVDPTARGAEMEIGGTR